MPDYRIEVRPLPGQPDPQGRRLLHTASLLKVPQPQSIRVCRLYFLRAALRPGEVDRACAELLVDPFLQEVEVRGLDGSFPSNGRRRIEVGYRPGVADREAKSLLAALGTMGLTADSAQSGWSYHIGGDLSEAELRQLAEGLLLNPVIQTYALGELQPHFQLAASAEAEVEEVLLRPLTPGQLLALGRARRLALSLAELQTVQAYFRQAGREPTRAELETVAQTWSEHCSHKTFKAEIDYDGPEGRRWIPGLLQHYIRRATEEAAKPWVLSAFRDNAGLVGWPSDFQVAFKVETHNHPSALEPFGGANTGVGGVVRDVLGVSARPIAATDVLCFGPVEADPPPGALHPRRVEAGVIAGIADYGNKLGVPAVAGAILYDPGYLGNPLVYCGCLGLAPRGSHPTEPKPGDRVVLIGGRTGRDGVGGATFSSAALEAGIDATVVQIGQPITQKGLVEVVERARQAGLYHAITDCGAGGLSSAVGEMAARPGGASPLPAELGVEVELEKVPLKHSGLAPWEIWLSEAQERMVLAVPWENLEALGGICRELGVEMSVIGRFGGDGRLRVRFRSRPVVDLPAQWLHGGRPPLTLKARWHPLPEKPWPAPAFEQRQALLALLAHPNIRSRAPVVHRYDHQVQGATVVGPLGPGVGAPGRAGGAGGRPFNGFSGGGVGEARGGWPPPIGPADGVVLSPLEAQGRWGLAIGHGINPWYGRLDPWAMGWAAVDEAVRNVVAVGADPERIALLDNFAWGDPADPVLLGGLVRACQGAYGAARAYDLPFISGKDSLNNTYRGQSIPGTLLISALGWVPDLTRIATTALKRPGSALYLIGETREEYGGSHLGQVLGCPGGRAPQPAEWGPAAARGVFGLIQVGQALACHDPAEGGLGVALAEMALAGGLGFEVEDHDLFAETQGRYVVEVAQGVRPALAGVPHTRLGAVTEEPRLCFAGFELAPEEARAAWAPSEPGLEEARRAWAEEWAG